MLEVGVLGYKIVQERQLRLPKAFHKASEILALGIDVPQEVVQRNLGDRRSVNQSLRDATLREQLTV
jgi:hypothetical protein